MSCADKGSNVPRPVPRRLSGNMSPGVVLLCLMLAPGCMALHTGLLEIVLYESVENGDYKTRSYRLNGDFSAAGSKVSAEGQLIQLHPLGLCNTLDYDELYNFGWVGVVKLEQYEPDQCLSVFEKAKRAIQRGATAVIFDVSDTPDATDKLQRIVDPLHRPVITIQGREAAKLMSIINTQKQAQVRLSYTQQDKMEDGVEISRKDYFNMVIFVAAFVIFSLICVFVILKVRWRNRERQLSMTTIAKRAISKLETRKYVPSSTKHKNVQTPDSDTSLHSSASESCAICLEGYREEQVLRVLPCNHDFHKHCVDPWLLSKGTCPLCKINITAQEEIPQNESVQPTIHDNITQTPSYPLPTPGGGRGNYMPLLYPARELPTNPSNHPHSHHLRNTCPSCEGTVGSSQSSCDSNRQNICYQQDCSTEHYYQNINCIHSIQEQRMLVETYRHSLGSHSHSQIPSSYMMLPSCQRHCGYSHHTGLAHRRHLFPPLLPSVRHVCETTAEREAVRAASIVAVRGSSSSDPNPSDTSLECDCCAQAGASTLLDSNRSTYGSSDNKDSSDVSSYDSSFYRDHSPSSNGDDKHHLPDETKLPTVHVRPSCGLGRNRRESDHREVAQNHVCKSQGRRDLDLVEDKDCAQEDVCKWCSGNSGTRCSHKKVNSSQANARRHGGGILSSSICRKHKPSVISIPRSQTFSSPREFGAGGDVRFAVRSGQTSHMCVQHHRVSAPPQMCKDTSAMFSPYGLRGGPHNSERRPYSLCLDCRSVYQGNGSLRTRTSQTAFKQWMKNSGSQGASGRPSRLNVCSNQGERGYSRLVRPMPYRPVMCGVCQRLTHVPVPRRSVVLYTEPQGSFVTIPLGEKEKYEPENGV